MLRFRLGEVKLERLGTCYLPLPKLTNEQVRLLGTHLRERGFSTVQDGRLRARGHGTYITVDPSGLAWSSSGLLDPIAPAIPRLLSMGKEQSGDNPYFSLKKSGRGFELQLFPRMESLRLWTELRREGACGLTEDESVVVRRLLAGMDAEVECVTDYPAEGSSVIRAGRRRYFSSSVRVEDFLANLRVAGASKARNAFLPRSSVIKVAAEPPRLDLHDVFEELGEWCYLRF